MFRTFLGGERVLEQNLSQNSAFHNLSINEERFLSRWHNQINVIDMKLDSTTGGRVPHKLLEV